MTVDRSQHRRAEEEKHFVVVRRVSRVEQIAVAGAERPVQMLSASVYAGERLLMKQAYEPVVRSCTAQSQHQQLLMIRGDVHVLVHAGHLVLSGRDFVVARLDRYPQPEHRQLDFVHVCEHTFWDRAEATRAQVGSLVVELLVDKEELLLGSDRRHNPAGLDAEQGERLTRGLIQRVDGA